MSNTKFHIKPTRNYHMLFLTYLKPFNMYIGCASYALRKTDMAQPNHKSLTCIDPILVCYEAFVINIGSFYMHI